MNKNFLVTLLQKDISELHLLTEGFGSMTDFPEPIVRLAKQKAENIVACLESLGQLPQSELGEIDCQSFDATYGETAETNPAKEPIFPEKNNFDAPIDSENDALQATDSEEDNHTMEVEIRPEFSEENKLPLYETTERNPNQVSEDSDEVDENQEFKSREPQFADKLNEEFQEEMEVEEMGENEQILTYEKSGKALEQTHIFKAPETLIRQENVNESINQHIVSLNETLSNHDFDSLSDSLANQKIDDIRQAMNIGDRFRFQRELFGGNGEVMNRTIAYLNQLAKYEEAVSFLKSKFGWSDENPDAEDFLQIVKRRF